jgi:hypothetical protein
MVGNPAQALSGWQIEQPYLVLDVARIDGDKLVVIYRVNLLQPGRWICGDMVDKAL